MFSILSTSPSLFPSLPPQCLSGLSLSFCFPCLGQLPTCLCPFSKLVTFFHPSSHCPDFFFGLSVDTWKAIKSLIIVWLERCWQQQEFSIVKANVWISLNWKHQSCLQGPNAHKHNFLNMYFKMSFQQLVMKLRKTYSKLRTKENMAERWAANSNCTQNILKTVIHGHDYIIATNYTFSEMLICN